MAGSLVRASRWVIRPARLPAAQRGRRRSSCDRQ